MSAFDPVSVALTQNRLDAITQRMGWVMTRTARSPIFSQSHDFSCFLTDAKGLVIAQADGIPIHTGSGGFVVPCILRDFDEINASISQGHLVPNLFHSASRSEIGQTESFLACNPGRSSEARCYFCQSPALGKAPQTLIIHF